MLSIELSSPESTFKPGSTLRGVVRMGMGGPPSSVSVSLVFLTEGRGTRDSEVVATTELPSLHPGSASPFEFVLPWCPFSFSGNLISVLYRIEASSSDHETALDIIVSPVEGEVRLSQSPDFGDDSSDEETALE